MVTHQCILCEVYIYSRQDKMREEMGNLASILDWSIIELKTGQVNSIKIPPFNISRTKLD
jgi:hypothetical protein